MKVLGIFIFMLITIYSNLSFCKNPYSNNLANIMKNKFINYFEEFAKIKNNLNTVNIKFEKGKKSIN